MPNPLQIVDKETGEVVQTEVVEFEDFWALFPRKVAKLDARKSWARIPESCHLEILVALVEWRRVWADKDYEYLPYPATWLRGERWTDEIPPAFVQSHASHAAASLPADTPRGIMPLNVKTLLAKLRGK